MNSLAVVTDGLLSSASAASGCADSVDVTTPVLSVAPVTVAGAVVVNRAASSVVVNRAAASVSVSPNAGATTVTAVSTVVDVDACEC